MWRTQSHLALRARSPFSWPGNLVPQNLLCQGLTVTIPKSPYGWTLLSGPATPEAGAVVGVVSDAVVEADSMADLIVGAVVGAIADSVADSIVVADVVMDLVPDSLVVINS